MWTLCLCFVKSIHIFHYEVRVNFMCLLNKQNGTLQHYQLGRLIRKRYTEEHQLINPNYTRDEVYVRSTDYDRTLMSVLSQLSALFPPGDQVIDSCTFAFVTACTVHDLVFIYLLMPVCTYVIFVVCVCVCV